MCWNFVIENMDFKKEINEYLQGSIVNRSKLEFKKSYPRFLENLI